MRSGREALRSAIDSVAEGTSDLDWGAIERQLENERDQELLRQLRILAHISDVQRSESAPLDDDLLTRRAKKIVSDLFVDIHKTKDLDEDEPSQTEPIEVAVERIVSQWGRLDLLERVGAGTFGEVYRAYDRQLQREVAVKLLHLRTSQERLIERVLHEARAMARVHHPNVVVVHDAEARDGRVGLCMEFIRGRTLEELLVTQGARGAREAALIGQDLCQALAAVHSTGLVHGDIKAQNVIREDGGRIVLMDFGAGRAAGPMSKAGGRLTGTPLYLAPEVLEGREATVRSDIYSLGVLLYHLVTTDFPVRGRTHDELVDAHREHRVHRLRDVAPTLPAWFVAVVERALAHDPQDRFASVGELEAALTRRPWSWPKHLLLALVAVIAIGIGVWQIWPQSGGSADQHPRVVLLPLEAGLGVEEHLANAITDEIYQGLAMVDTLRVIPQSSARRAQQTNLSIAGLTSQLQASAVLNGTVSDAGGEFEVRLRLFEGGRDAPSWAGTFRASKAGLGSLRRDTALAIAGKLNANVSPHVLTLLSRPAQASSQAFESYARGRFLLMRAGRTDLERARIELERTIELEPTYAPAYASLARAHLDLGANGRQSEWVVHGDMARTAARRAISLEPQLAEAQAVLGQVAFLLDWDWQRAEASYKAAIALSPSYDYPRHRYAMYLAARGQVDQAIAIAEEARRLDPVSDETDFVLIPLLQYDRRFTEAEALALAVQGRQPNSRQTYTQLGRIYAATNQFDKAIEMFRQIVDPASGGAYVEAEIASAHAGAGRIADAQKGLDRLVERARTEEIPPELFSLIYARLGQFDEAFHQLAEAVELKSRRILWMKVDPRWDPLRSDPRFDVLIQRLGL
jgi:tetratricopeptide (TPR) repeat protein